MRTENPPTNSFLEKSFLQKEIRLPRSVRAYIRNLKSQGRLEEALGIAAQTREAKSRKREERAREELNLTIRELLESENPEVQAEKETKAIWLLEATGFIGSEERLQELIANLDSKAPELRERLESKLSAIRDGVEPYMPVPSFVAGGKRLH